MTGFLSVEDLCLSIQDTNLSDVEEATYNDLQVMRCEFESEERYEDEFRSLLCLAGPRKTTPKSVAESEHLSLFLDATKEDCPVTTDEKLANGSLFSTFTAQDRKANGLNRAETNVDNVSCCARSTHKPQSVEEVRMASTLSKPVCNSCCGKENSLEEVFDTAARQINHMNRVNGNPILLKEKTSVSKCPARRDLSASHSTMPTRALSVVTSSNCEVGKFCLPESSNHRQVHKNQAVQSNSFDCGGNGEVPFSARIVKCIEFELSLLKGKKCIEIGQNSRSRNSPTEVVSVLEEPPFASKDWEPFESEEESYCGKRRKLKERSIRGANEFDSLMEDHTH